MKTNEKTVADLIERKRKYDEKRAARKRIVAITAAALAVIIVVASVPVFALAAANRKTPAAPVVTDGSTDGVAATEETSETAPDTEEQTGAVPDTEEQTKRAEEKTGDDQANKHTGEWEYGLKVDFYEKDKKDPLILSKEEYGRSKWMSKDMIKQYHIDMPVDHLPDDYDFSDYEEDFYGYAKKPDGIYELEISLKNSENWVGAEYLLRIEAEDGVEILSETTIRSVFREYNDYGFTLEPGDYTSIPLRFRFTSEKNWADIYIYIFVRAEANDYHGAFDHITEAEEYFASGKSMADKAFPPVDPVTGYCPLRSAMSGRYQGRFMEIKGYDFFLNRSNMYGTDELYERAALYFGDVDENGVPLFISNPNDTEYQNPCMLPKTEDRPVYDGSSINQENRGDNYDISPLSVDKAENKADIKGDANIQYNIIISGVINWSINDEDIQGTDTFRHQSVV